MNLPLSNLALYPPLKNIDTATSHAPVFQVPEVPGSLEISQHSSQTDLQSHRTSTDPSPVLGLPSEPLSDESHTISAPSNSTGDYPLATTHGIHIIDTDNHPMASVLKIHPERSGSKAVQQRIDEMAKVIQLVISPTSNHHTLVLEGSEKKAGE